MDNQEEEGQGSKGAGLMGREEGNVGGATLYMKEKKGRCNFLYQNLNFPSKFKKQMC